MLYIETKSWYLASEENIVKITFSIALNPLTRRIPSIANYFVRWLAMVTATNPRLDEFLWPEIKRLNVESM